MQPKISIHKNAAKNELVVLKDNIRSTLDLSKISIYAQIELVNQLINWKNNGYKGTAPI